jgi:glycosyltransferase involved in cell wall biosynthesis
MKVLLLAEANSSHIIKWAGALSDHGIEVGIFSLNGFPGTFYKQKSVPVYTPFTLKEGYEYQKWIYKWKYLLTVSSLKKVIRHFKPDILHAHYASSYGLIGALSGFHPLIISVWGSDIYGFPEILPFGRQIIRYNLHSADKILSTSKAIAAEVKKYTSREVTITHFGVDPLIFKPIQNPGLFTQDELVIGTIKGLENVYGIDILIESFHRLILRNPHLPLRLLIVGGGTLDESLKQKVRSLGIMDQVIFTGKIPHDQVPLYHNMLTVYAALSRSESFGVAALEASACGKPVVVFDVGGLKEVVEDQVSGFVIPFGETDRVVEAFDKLIKDPLLARKLGQNGRERVIRNYNWKDNVTGMLGIYNDITSHKNSL